MKNIKDIFPNKILTLDFSALHNKNINNFKKFLLDKHSSLQPPIICAISIAICGCWKPQEFLEFILFPLLIQSSQVEYNSIRHQKKRKFLLIYTNIQQLSILFIIIKYYFDLVLYVLFPKVVKILQQLNISASFMGLVHR